MEVNLTKSQIVFLLKHIKKGLYWGSPIVQEDFPKLRRIARRLEIKLELMK